MKNLRLKLIPIAIVVLVVGAFLGGYAYGLNIYQKTLDAIGFVKITDETTITEMEIDDAATLKVQVAPTVNTQAGLTYTVHVYLDGIDTAQQPLSWTQPEIDGSVKKKATFTGLSLGTATSVKAEVTH